LVVIIGAACGFIEYRRWQEFKDQAKKSAEETKKCADDAKSIIEGLKKMTEEETERLRKKFKQFPPLPKSLSEDEKETLEDYGRRIEILESFGLPLTYDDYMSRATDLYYKRAYEVALIALNKAIELKPDLADAWSNKGVTLGKLDRKEEALAAYEKAIELKPDLADAWSNKGVTLDDLDRKEEALAAYEKAIELKPDYAAAWYNKACLYAVKGDKQNALENLSKAVELDVKYKEMAKRDEDFKNLWDDEDFLKIVS
jgi:tetratricopeptide (TPR) repeat protein